jgi:hypothetical protein
MASCDLVAAALGVCGCSASVGEELEYQLCAVKRIESSQSTVSVEKPKRLCRYYTNGTIDIPTLTVIETYIEVGQRLCIGDEVPEARTHATNVSELENQFRAQSSRPTATWEPGGELEIKVSASFLAEYQSRVVDGELFGQSASIRFRAESYRWTFSDGTRLSGAKVEKSFMTLGEQRALAHVLLSVDYKLAGEPWVLDAYRGEVSSQELWIPVIEIPRRTLLVAG